MTDQMLHGRVVYSTIAHGMIKSFSLDAALRIEGVHAILSYKECHKHFMVQMLCLLGQINYPSSEYSSCSYDPTYKGKFSHNWQQLPFCTFFNSTELL